MRGTVAQIMVRFVSDQISLTRDKDGKEVSGTDAVTELTDLWTFEREIWRRAIRLGGWWPRGARDYCFLAATGEPIADWHPLRAVRLACGNRQPLGSPVAGPHP